MSSDASLVSFLQSELLLLSNEIKKKYPEIKESIENIFQLIRKIKDDPERPSAVEVFSQTECILQPIILACRTGNARVIGIAINCLQKLVMFQAFPRECLGSVFTVLECTIDLNSDIQLKGLQCLSPLMANYSDIYGSELIRLFSIAFRIQESKLSIVNNAAAAIIRQILISLFERVHQEISSSESDLGSHSNDALLLMSDIICRLDDEKPAALDLSKIDKPFALDLIESILSNHGAVIRTQKKFSVLMRDRLCPHIITSLKNEKGKGDFAKSCRQWRLVQLIIVDFHDLFPDEVEIYVAFFVRILRESTSPWEHAIVMEIVKSIFSSLDLQEAVFVICEKRESVRLFRDLLEAVIGLMKMVLNTNPSEPAGAINESYLRYSVINQFDKSVPPPTPILIPLLLAYETFFQWFGNLTTLAKTHCIEESKSKLVSIKAVAAKDELILGSVQIASDLLAFIGAPLIEVIQRVFEKVCYNQVTLHTQTIEFFSRFLVIYAVFGFSSDLIDVMSLMLKLSQPASNESSAYTSSNFLITRMVLSTSLSILELLSDAWYPLAQIIHYTDNLRVVRERRMQIQGIAPPSSSEEHILAQAIDLSSEIIESSAELSEPAFTALVRAYSQVLEETLLEGISANMTMTLLALEKIKRILILNIFRFIERDECSTSWTIVVASLANCLKSASDIRQGCMEIISVIVDLMIKSITSSRMKISQIPSSEDKSRIACLSLQLRILEPMKEASQRAVTWMDVHQSLLDILFRYLQAFGETMAPEAWSLTWSILENALKMSYGNNNSSPALNGSNGGNPEAINIQLYRGVHEILKFSCSDLLSSIPMICQRGLIDLIAEMAGESERLVASGELNIPLNSIRYLWDISDFLCTRVGFDADGCNSRTQEAVLLDPQGSACPDASRSCAFSLWLHLLGHLKRLGLDSRPELRNSSIQTLLRTISMNSGILKEGERATLQWQRIFEEILLKFMAELRIAASQQIATSSPTSSTTAAAVATTSFPLGFVHFTRDSVEKQWDESEAAAIAGMTSLLQSTLSLSPALSSTFYSKYWPIWLKTLKNYILLVRGSGSIELTSIAINSLLAMVQFPMNQDAKWEIWRIWNEIGEEAWRSEPETTPTSSDAASVKSGLSSPYFTQDALVKFVTIFSCFSSLSLGPGDLKRSLKVLTRCLRVLTSSDQVRDTEAPLELQKYVCQNILTELFGGPSEWEKFTVEHYSVIWTEVARWLHLCKSPGKRADCTETAGSTGFIISTNNAFTAVTTTEDSPQISIGYPSLRMRQSTSSSYCSIQDPSTSTARPGYSYIAMTSLLLENLGELFAKNAGEESFYSPDGPVVKMLRALRRYLRWKYLCPASGRVPALWKSATDALISLSRAAFTANTRSQKYLHEAFWPSLLKTLQVGLVTSRGMFNRSLTTSQSEADEVFDCRLIDFIANDLVKYANGSEGYEEELIKLLLKTAIIIEFSGDDLDAADDDEMKEVEELEDHVLGNDGVSVATHLSMFPSGVKPIPVAIKETLAFRSYSALFSLAMSSDAKLRGLIIPRILTRLRLHLEAFIIDRQILGEFPLTRLRDRELRRLLRGVLKLQCGGMGARGEKGEEASTASREISSGLISTASIYKLIVETVEWAALNDSTFSGREIIQLCRQILQNMSAATGDEKEKDLATMDIEESDFSDFETEAAESAVVEKEESSVQDASLEALAQGSSEQRSGSGLLQQSQSSSHSQSGSRGSRDKESSARRSLSEEFFSHLARDMQFNLQLLDKLEGRGGSRKSFSSSSEG